jgi:hypothetical protein
VLDEVIRDNEVSVTGRGMYLLPWSPIDHSELDIGQILRISKLDYSSIHKCGKIYVAPSPTKSQTNRVQTTVTKCQAKAIANTLNHISHTQAGQSFKAPVEQLWPECADAYAAKISNPIDLGDEGEE